MVESIFLKIARKEIPAHIIYEDPFCISFLDVKPHVKGHTIVIPKKKGVTVFDFNEEDLQNLMVAVKNTMERLQEVLSPDGFNVGWNHNTAGGQVVPHLHFHIMPRWLGDGGGSMHSIITNPGKINVDAVAKLFKE